MSIAFFVALVFAFSLVSKHFGVALEWPVTASVIALLAPYWFFGFGFGEWLRRRNLRSAWMPMMLIGAWLLYAIPTNQFEWAAGIGMCAVLLSTSWLLSYAHALSPGN